MGQKGALKRVERAQATHQQSSKRGVRIKQKEWKALHSFEVRKPHVYDLHSDIICGFTYLYTPPSQGLAHTRWVINAHGMPQSQIHFQVLSDPLISVSIPCNIQQHKYDHVVQQETLVMGSSNTSRWLKMAFCNEGGLKNSHKDEEYETAMLHGNHHENLKPRMGIPGHSVVSIPCFHCLGPWVQLWLEN